MTENFRFIRVPLLAALMGLLVSLTAPSHAATWYVRPDGDGSGTGWGDARSTVKSAISSSKAGDEIWVASGVYNESLNLKGGISLYGGFAGTETVREDRDFAANPTILDATGLNQRVITADGTNGVTIDGFTIRNGSTPTSGASQYRRGGGISFNNVSSATVSNCTITGNTTDDNGGGISIYFSSSLTLRNCAIIGNTAGSGGGGVNCIFSSLTLTHCTISGNGASTGGGLYISGSPSSWTLIHCTISGNTASSGEGVYCLSTSPTFINCILWNPGKEIFVGSGVPVVRYSCVQGGFPGEGNIDAYPKFVDPLNGDWRLRDGSPCVDRGTDLGLPYDGEAPDMGSWEAPEIYSQGPPDHVPQLFHVSAGASKGGDGLTWGSAFSSVGEALLHSSTADKIWVSGGIYNESIHLESGSAIYGGFVGTETVCEERNYISNTTILDAAGLNQRVVTAGGTEGAIMDGFTIRNGNSAGSGGGILFNSVSVLTVSNCTISGNTASNNGGGVYCSNSLPNLTNCTLVDNMANRNGGGIYFAGSSSPNLTNCTISRNTVPYSLTSGRGAGVYCSPSSSPKLTHCMISGNVAGWPGGGLYCATNSSPILTHCTISGNTASYGGGVYCDDSSTPTLTHCTITGNTANGPGGGVYLDRSSSSTLTDSTISGNAAGGGGGGVVCDGSSSTLTNCTISSNTSSSNGGGVLCIRNSACIMANCMISDNTTRDLGGGVVCVVSSFPMLIDCTISGNTASSGGGVYCRESSPTLTNCILWNPGNEISVDSGEPAVRYSCVQGGYPGEGNIDAYPQFVDPFNGDWRLRDGSPCIDRGTDVGLPFNGAGPDMGSWEAPENYSLEPPDPAPHHFYVNAHASKGGNGLTWETAFASVGEAMLYSVTAVEIWVSAGTYNEAIRLESGSALYGGFAGTENSRKDRNVMTNITVLDAAGLNQRVITADRSEGITIDGFAIQNGTSVGTGGGLYFVSVSSATVSNCTITNNTATGQFVGGGSGGGVYCYNSSPTLTKCTIVGNTAAVRDGGGVFCDSSSPRLTHCTIAGNTANCDGGGVCFDASSPWLMHCTITGNTANRDGGGMFSEYFTPMLSNCAITENTANRDGGGVHCNYSRPSLTHCTILENTSMRWGGGVYCFRSSPTLKYSTVSGNTADESGGGMYCADRSSPTVTHCTIPGNTAVNSDGGGLYCEESSSPRLTQCKISGNMANRDGGGIYSINRSSPSLSHCTINDNTAIGDGAGLASLDASSPTLINCILWNGGDEVFRISATAEVTFSAVQGGFPGEGNIDGDPMFVDPEQSDFRLAMGSPCIDSGSSGAVLRLGPSVLALGDLDGRMRIWDGDADGFAVVDMGAYEFGPPPFVGDVFGDSRVNHLDLFRLQQVWKEEGEDVLPEADQDGDKTIGASDLVILLHAWGNMTGP